MTTRYVPTRAQTGYPGRTLTTQTTPVTPAKPPPRTIRVVYFWILVAVIVLLVIALAVTFFYLQTYRKAQFDTTLCPNYLPPTTCPDGCTGTPTPPT